MQFFNFFTPVTTNHNKINNFRHFTTIISLINESVDTLCPSDTLLMYRHKDFVRCVDTLLNDVEALPVVLYLYTRGVQYSLAEIPITNKQY